MAIIKCKMCGGDLTITEDATVAICEYCGIRQTIPTADNEKKLTLFARANRLRMACEFDKAAGVYESIVAEFPTEAEAYWGLVLCRYGIEYVDDPATGAKVPTCHRSSFDSILEDSDFEQAQENADVVARRVYREEAKAIEKLRQRILEVSSREEPYDIFICYKEVAEDGQRTMDSVIAQDVYDALTEKGYRVFFSRVTLEDKLGVEYEPYIFAALNSSKIMLVFGTDYEYFNAVWVKNEWSRFLSLIAAGQKKVLIPCFKGVDAYDMPKEFFKLQAQDMGKVGAIQDLLRGIEKILCGTTTNISTESQDNHIKAQALSQADNTVRLGIMAVNSGDSQKGIQYFEEALKMNPDHIGAYLGMVRALPDEQVKPYSERLLTFPINEIEEYLKQNTEMLSDANVSLLNQIIYHTESPELVNTLLNAGANPNVDYILRIAVRSERRHELVPLLLEAGADPNREYLLRFNDGSQEQCTVLRDVIWGSQDVEIAKLLIDYGADVNYIVKSNKQEEWSLLDMAVIKKDEQMVRFLLDKGADPNSGRKRCIKGYEHLETFFCVLSEAIRNAKNINIIHMLLDYGADPNYQYKDYFTSRGRSFLGVSDTVFIDGNKLCTGLYDAICYFESDEVVKILLSAGANPSITYECELNGEFDSTKIVVPILAIAVLEEKKEEVDMLLKAGASLNEICYEKRGIYESRAPLKKCDCGFSGFMKGMLYNLGWKGPSIFTGMNLVDIRY